MKAIKMVKLNSGTKKVCERNNKILFISYHFPPDSAVGAIRPAKFAKYLKRFGWKPYILTIKDSLIPYKDYERFREVSDLPVFRTTVWPTIPQVALKIRNGIKQRFFNNNNAKSNVVDYRLTLRNEERYKLSSINATIRKVFNSIFELPDREIGWCFPAFWKAYWLIKKEDIRIIITSSPPRSVALIGLFLSWVTKTKLITDLRDPWFLGYNKPKIIRSVISDFIEIKLERKIIAGSDRIITTTENYKDFLQRYYSPFAGEKFYTIWNGYDEEDFKGTESIKTGDKFTISYLGTFYYGRTPREFLKAIYSLIKDNSIDRSDIEVNFIGNVRYAEGESIKKLVESLNLDDCVTIQDPIPYKESLNVMKKSHVLLLFAPDQHYCIPAKGFEYLRVKRRILCFSQNGATSDLINKTGAGLVVDPSDTEQIKEAIQRLYYEYKNKIIVNQLFDTTIYERQNLSEILSNIIYECIVNNK